MIVTKLNRDNLVPHIKGQPKISLITIEIYINLSKSTSKIITDHFQKPTFGEINQETQWIAFERLRYVALHLSAVRSHLYF